MLLSTLRPAHGAHLSDPPARVLGAGGQQDITRSEVGVHKAPLGVDEAQARGQLYGCKAQGGRGTRGREAAKPPLPSQRHRFAAAQHAQRGGTPPPHVQRGQRLRQRLLRGRPRPPTRLEERRQLLPTCPAQHALPYHLVQRAAVGKALHRPRQLAASARRGWRLPGLLQAV